MKNKKQVAILSTIIVVMIVAVIVALVYFSGKTHKTIGDEELVSVSMSVSEENVVELPKPEQINKADETDKTSETDKTNENEATDVDLQKVYSSLCFDNLPDEICEVFHSGREFVRSETGEYSTIYDFTLERNELNKPLYWTSYYVLDLDRDGQNELIFVISDKMEAFPANVIFTLLDEEVYAYTRTRWLFRSIFSDSTIIGADNGSASAADYYRIVSFNKEGYETEIMASGDGIEHTFTIGGEDVSEDAFWDYITPMAWNKEKAVPRWANVDVMYPNEMGFTYESIIKEAKKCLKGMRSIHIGVTIKLSNEFREDRNKNRNLGYLIKDINADGIEDLLLGEPVNTDINGEISKIYDIYSIDDGRVYQVLNGAEDYYYLICNDSVIIKETIADDNSIERSSYVFEKNSFRLTETLIDTTDYMEISLIPLQ